jgi:hypothetical protein
VFAHSPEAKGRVERANGTFQDRLVSELRLADASTLEEANYVLSKFLPRFNARFGVPATQAGSAYRVPDASLDIAGVLCHKEWRRVARDNTVQYHGRTLQLFAGVDRPSLAGARVEVRERLDGSLMVAYRGTALTPSEAPALAAALRDQVNAIPKERFPEPEQMPRRVRHRLTSTPGKRSSSTIWYEDSELKRRHKELVKAGMERARKLGKRIGRPSVTDRDGFAGQFREVVARIGPDGLSPRQAARELGISLSTLRRRLDDHEPSSAATRPPQPTLLPSVNGRYMPQNEATDIIAQL